MAIELAEAYVSLKMDVRNLARDMNSVKSSLDRHFDEIEKKARQAGMATMAIFSGAIAGGAILLTKSFVSAAISMERMMNGLKSVAGSSAEAEKQLVDLREVAKLPGLGLPEAMKGSIALQSVRMEAGKAKEVLIQFGNALAIAGRGREDLEGVIRQLTQMKGKGKVMEEELRIIYERLPSLRSAMMDLGFTTAEAFNKSGKSVDEFINMALAGLSKLPRVAGGTANAIENMKDAWFQLKVTLGDVLLPTFAKIVDKLSGIIEWVNKLSDTQKSWLSWGIVAVGAVAGITGALMGLGLAIPGIISGVKLLGSVFIWFSAHPAVAVITAIGLAITAIALMASKLKEGEQVSKTTLENMASKVGSMTKIERDLWIKRGEAQIKSSGKIMEGYKTEAKGLEALISNEKKWTASVGMSSEMQLEIAQSLNLHEKRYTTLQEKIRTTTEDINTLGKAIGTLKNPPVLGPEQPKTEALTLPIIDTKAFTELSGLIEAQSRLRMALIGTIGDQYERERKEALETYRLEAALSKDKIASINAELAAARKKLETPAEIAAAEAQAAVGIKATQAELQAAYQEYLNKRSESYKKQVEDIKKREEELLKNLELTEKQKIAIRESTRLALFQLAVRTVEEDFSIMTAAYQADKTERDKQRQKRLDAEKKQKSEIEKIWAGYKSQDKGGGIKRVKVQTSTDLDPALLDPALKEWTDFYTTVTEEAKAFYGQITANHKAWGLMSLEELKAVKDAWKIAGKDIATGWDAVMVKLSLTTGNWADVNLDLITGLASGIEASFSTLFEGIFTNINNMQDVWKSFCNSLYRAFAGMLAKMIAKWAAIGIGKIILQLAGLGGGGGFLELLGSALIGGFAEGGIAKGGLQIPKLASGGIYNKPTLALIGEGSRDEAVIPLKGGKVPVELNGGTNGFVINNLNISFPELDLSNVDQSHLTKFIQKRFIPAMRDAVRDGFMGKAAI